MKRVLLIGKNGQLGWELHRSLATLGELTVVDYPEVDLQNPVTYRELIRKIQPHILVNAAAYTAVDQAEAEQAKAWTINAIASGVMAEEACRLKAIFVHYSTDYVFDGKKGTAYYEEDKPNPVNFYGRSKLEGEKLVQEAGGTYLIFRTSWVYSLRLMSGFVIKILQWARQQEKMQVVSDQISNPTWARVLAQATSLVLMLDPDTLHARRGLYHAAGGGFTSRFDWAKMILELYPDRKEQIVKEVLPALTSDFPTSAQRPFLSALNSDRFQKTFGVFLPEWQETLKLSMSR
jgi:dTDP-4-dehydrorhamnose reductase